MVIRCAQALRGLAYWLGQYAPGTAATSSRTRAIRTGWNSPVTGSPSSTVCTSAPSARMIAMFCGLVRGSTTQMNLRSMARHICAMPTPRFPELDSTTVPVPGTTAPVATAWLSMV